VRGGNRGIALIMTLWVLVLLSVVALQFSAATRTDSLLMRNFKGDLQARYIAMSAMESAKAYILTDPDNTVDYVDAEGRFHTDEDREPYGGNATVGNMSVEVAISDEDSRLNINLATERVLTQALSLAGVEPENAAKLTDALHDWLDPDDLHRLNGAETDYYTALGYPAKNGDLNVPEELLLVKDFSPEMYYGTITDEGSETAGIEQFVTVWGTSMNINTIPEALLDAMGFDPVQVDTVIAMRNDGLVLRTAPAGFEGVQATASKHIRITVRSGTLDSERVLKLTGVFIREQGLHGEELRPLYWKEEFEDRRA